MIHINEIGKGDERFDDIIHRFPDSWPAFISVGWGWADLVLECHSRLVAFDENYKVLQIKQKFGGLRYYFTPSHPAYTKYMSAKLIDLEKRSYLVCEICGQPGNLRTKEKQRYFQALCIEHSPDDQGYISASTIHV